MLNPNAIQRITALSNDDVILVADRDINRTNRGRTDLYTKKIRYSDLLTSLSSDLDIAPAATWGDITGTLSSQTDLQSALDGKLNLTGGNLSGQLTLSSGIPILEFKDTSGSSANESIWQWRNENGTLRLQPLTDAGSGGGDLMDITRTSNAMTALILKDNAAATITLNNTGTGIFSRNVTTSGITKPPLELDGSSSSISWDVDRSQNAILEVGTDIIVSIGRSVAGEVYKLVVSNPSGNNVEIDGVIWPGGTPPTFSTGIDIATIFYDGVNLYGTIEQDFR